MSEAESRLIDTPFGFVVELEPGVWLAEWSGDPGRTCDRKNAKVYQTEHDAIRGKARARRMKPFRAARIEPALTPPEDLND